MIIKSGITKISDNEFNMMRDIGLRHSVRSLYIYLKNFADENGIVNSIFNAKRAADAMAWLPDLGSKSKPFVVNSNAIRSMLRELERNKLIIKLAGNNNLKILSKCKGRICYVKSEAMVACQKVCHEARSLYLFLLLHRDSKGVVGLDHRISRHMLSEYMQVTPDFQSKYNSETFCWEKIRNLIKQLERHGLLIKHKNTMAFTIIFAKTQEKSE